MVVARNQGARNPALGSGGSIPTRRDFLSYPEQCPQDDSAERRPTAVTKDINVLALVKGEERYIFLYDDQRRAETLRTLGKFASDPNLSFSWFDAAVLSQKVRQSAQQSRAEEVARRFEFPSQNRDAA